VIVRALVGLFLVACGTSAVPGALTATATPPPATAGIVATTSAPATVVTVAESRYGRAVVRTEPGIACTVEVHVGRPTLGDVPEPTLRGTADGTGTLTLTYAAPALPKQTGRHVVACGSGRADADFAIAGYPIDARRFTARIRVADMAETIDGVTAKPEPSLASARDADVTLLKRTLAAEWSAATRGLSTLELVDGPADMVLTVVTARAQSFLRRWSGDSSMAIYLFPADSAGQMSADNFVAIALHELGHIWCCSGPDASPDGHWARPVADPLLEGIDRFGIMNHPVSCTIFAVGVQSCPNRFSDRELRTMGFTSIPAPPRNACIDQRKALLAQLATLADQLKSGKAGLDASDAALATQKAQIASLEARYPGGMPPDVYATYKGMVDRYNAGVAAARTRLAAYNVLVDQNNGVVDQVNRLVC
jgi:hypothetical protein